MLLATSMTAYLLHGTQSVEEAVESQALVQPVKSLCSPELRP